VARYAIKSYIMENKINYAAMSLDEIIFIDRNKFYGAYDLRRSYPEHIKRSLLGLLFFITLAVAGQKILSLWHPSTALEESIIVCKLAEVQPPTIPDKPKISPPSHGNPNAATAAVAVLEPAKDNIPEKDTTLAPDPNPDLSDHPQAGIPGEKAGSPEGTGLAETKVEEPKEPQLVNWAEFMPEYPGGDEALNAFLKNNLEYPRYEAEERIQGKVSVGFIIDENGKVTNIHVMKGVSRGLDDEAMRVVKLLHDFKPGSQSGRKVRVSYVIPIAFRLGQE
jgi:protein TonB